MTNTNDSIIQILRPELTSIIEEYLKSRLSKFDQRPSEIKFEDELPITTDVLAERMGLSKSFLYQQVSKKLIPYHKKHKRLYFIPSEICDWIRGTWKKTDN